jgi:hypothetical protein
MRKGLAAIEAADFVYDEYLSRIDARAVLEHYGAEHGFEQVNTDGTVEIIHSCLLDRVITHHANGDASPSAAMNLDKKTYVCYSYSDPDTGKSGYDIFHFIQKMEGKRTLNEIVPFLAQFLDGSVRAGNDFVERIKEVFAAAARGADSTHVAGVSERVLDSWAFTHPYVVERGIDLDTASRLHIGYDPVENRITIPHFWRGRLVGWQKRAIPACPAGSYPPTANPVPKYRSSSGFPKGTTLYRGDSAARSTAGRVVVVESPFSVIKAEALGLDIPVVATFGSKVTDRQVELIADFPRVIVWADDDDAGRGMERRLVTANTNVRVVTPDAGMDLGDYDSADLIQAKIDTAVPSVLKQAQWSREKKQWLMNNLT